MASTSAVRKVFEQHAGFEGFRVFCVFPHVDPERGGETVSGSIQIAEGIAEAIAAHGGQILTGVEKEGGWDFIFIRATAAGAQALEERLRGAASVSDWSFHQKLADKARLTVVPGEAAENLIEVAIKIYPHDSKWVPISVRPEPVELGLPPGAEVPEGNAWALHNIPMQAGALRQNVAITVNGIAAVLAAHGGHVLTGDERSYDNGFIIARTTRQGFEALKEALKGIALVWDHELPDLSNMKRYECWTGKLYDRVSDLGYDAVMWLKDHKPHRFWNRDGQPDAIAEEMAVRLMRDQYAQRMRFVEGYLGQSGKDFLMARTGNEERFFQELLWADDYQQQIIKLAHTAPQPPSSQPSRAFGFIG